ncbi:MAG: hypothetical protein ACKO1F_12640, partial [Flammeovirgaceae bacterium]
GRMFSWICDQYDFYIWWGASHYHRVNLSSIGCSALSDCSTHNSIDLDKTYEWCNYDKVNFQFLIIVPMEIQPVSIDNLHKLIEIVWNFGLDVILKKSLKTIKLP